MTTTVLLATLGDLVRGAMLLGVAVTAGLAIRELRAAHRRGLERVANAARIAQPSHVRVLPAQRAAR